ncbi:MAG: C45 family autoproteolytic acyltransferase/hydrolase [Promethearchaeota archaeon]
MVLEKFPLITVHGSSSIEIGFQHGKKLKERIQKTIQVYHMATNLKEDVIFDRAAHFKRVIYKFNPDYCDEIEAIAKGAGVNPSWIYALNGRTELVPLLSHACTALYFSKTGILAQNWDWAEALESLSLIMRIKKNNGHEILQVTEPGIIGKIGFNDKGIGACLNFLDYKGDLNGVPIHILLRAVLDSSNLEEAVNKMKNHEHGTASNILIGTDKGKYVDVEFADKQIFLFENSNEDEIFIHTNHYLDKASVPTLIATEEDIINSHVRYDQALNLAKQVVDQSIEDMKKILLNKSNKKHPICRKYVRHPLFGRSGSVCSIIMNLPRREMHVTKGNPTKHDYELIKL